MEAKLENLNLKNLDKSNWKTYRFEDIAKKISKTVKPEEAEVDIYVGLEHLDAEDIHIRRKGVPADVKGGKLRCSPGDVIFGKRRAYQRKAAVVDFEGICSAHAFVFRANAEVMDPNLFPFFLHSDQFMHRMVDISVGGLSPTINWGDLKNQEFYLPPLDQQKILAELLWKYNDLSETQLNLKSRCQILFDSLIKDHFISNFLKRTYKLKNFVKTFIVPMRDKPKIFDGPIPWCRIEDFNGTYLSNSKSGRSVSYSTIKEMNLKVYPVGTVLVSCSADLGRCAITSAPLITNQTFIGLVTKDNILNKYLYYLMRSMAPILNKISSGTTISYLSRKQFEDLKVHVPAKEIQEEIVTKLEEIEKQLDRISDYTLSAQRLNKTLINQIF